MCKGTKIGATLIIKIPLVQFNAILTATHCKYLCFTYQIIFIQPYTLSTNNIIVYLRHNCYTHHSMKKLFTTCILSLALSSTFAQTESSAVLAYPNPARYDVSFSYNTFGANGPVSIIVTDMIGQKIVELPVKDKQGMIEWNTNSVPNGIYIYKLKDSSKTLAIGRLTIAK